MNWAFLDYFLAAAEMESFSKAADSLFYTQPSLSKKIKALEADLGCTLFERKNKRVELTEAGEFLYEHLTQINRDIDELHKQMKQFETHDKPENSLTVYSDAYSYLLTSEIIKTYLSRYPDNTVTHLTESVGDSVENADVFCHYSLEREHRNEGILFRSREIVVLHDQSPLAAKRKLALEDLSEYRYIALQTSSRVRDIVSYLERAPYPFEIFRTDSPYEAMNELAQDPKAFEIWEEYSHLKQPIYRHVLRPMTGLGRLEYHVDMKRPDRGDALLFHKAARDFCHQL